MKKFIFVVLAVLISTNLLFSQDYSIETKTEEKIDGSFTTTRTINLVKESGITPLPWLDIQISDRINSVENVSELQFWFNYVGNSWRFYDKVVFNIDGTVFTFTFRSTRQTMGGSMVAEICFTENLNNEFRNALKNATSIRYQTSGLRVVDDIAAFSTEAIEAIKRLL